MPERPGPWDLLGQPSDPVVADVAEADARLGYFRSLAEDMRQQGERLHAISSGEELKGKYADALRSSAGTERSVFSRLPTSPEFGHLTSLAKIASS